MVNIGYRRGEYIPRDNVHVYPVKDSLPHVMSAACHCHPREHWRADGNIVTVHNSYDHREFREYKRKLN